MGTVYLWREVLAWKCRWWWWWWWWWLDIH